MFSEYLLSDWERDDRKYSRRGGGSGGGGGGGDVGGVGCVLVVVFALIMSLMNGDSVEKERREWLEKEKQKSVQRYNEDKERREKVMKQNEMQFMKK